MDEPIPRTTEIRVEIESASDLGREVLPSDVWLPTLPLNGSANGSLKIPRLPTQDELPYDDGEPMESERHRLQMNLLIETLRIHWSEREDFFAGGNMFVYFSPKQIKHNDFRGPDFFVALGVDGKRERKSWVSWEEGKVPDMVLELLSESTSDFDKSEKKQIYQDRLKAKEYYWFDPFEHEWAGFILRQGVYEEIIPDSKNRLVSETLQLALVQRPGEYQGHGDVWLRFETLAGELLVAQYEIAEQERERAEAERERAEAERERAEAERERAEAERERAEAERARADRLAEKLRALGIDPNELV